MFFLLQPKYVGSQSSVSGGLLSYSLTSGDDLHYLPSHIVRTPKSRWQSQNPVFCVYLKLKNGQKPEIIINFQLLCLEFPQSLCGSIYESLSKWKHDRVHETLPPLPSWRTEVFLLGRFMTAIFSYLMRSHVEDRTNMISAMWTAKQDQNVIILNLSSNEFVSNRRWI